MTGLNFSINIFCRYITNCSPHYLLYFCNTLLSLKILGLKIGFWNIDDLLEKRCLMKPLRKKEINITSYFYVRHEEDINNLRHPVFKNKRRNKGCPLGGILIYFCSELNKVLPVFDKSNENILWVKIGKSSLSNKSNTYIACVYNSKKNSTYIK